MLTIETSDFDSNIFEDICYRDICGIYGENSDATYLHIQELNETKDSIGNLTREERNVICNALKEFADNRKLPGHSRLNANRIKHYFE